MSTNKRPALVLYRQVGTNYIIQATATPGDTNSWQHVWSGAMPDLFEGVEPTIGAEQASFFRARKE